ncbi:MAG: serine/threonine-protein kinase PknK, partial [Myxococcales bacterium]|nr:serine/threonine-protein kinase PknK [Myxococcales bacterium]
MRPTSHQRERDSAPRDDVDFPGTPRFAIRRRIGEGAMGVVYDAFDRDLECRVALKTLRRGDAKSLYRFKREFRTLQDIEHPNLIRYGEMFFDADTWFFTMEFIEGVDFYQYVRPAHPMPPALDAPVLGLERGFDEERLRDGMRQLAVAIHTIHRLQIVHRDIKPTNIRVTSRGRVVLLDFGLLTRQEPGDDHAPRGIVGTATYMSPEQAYSGPIGPSSDWYSLGVVLYLALTGRRPFRGKTPMEILMSKLEDAPLAPREWVRDVPQDLDTLCRRLMQSEPDLRPLGDEVVRELGGDPREIDGWIESRAESVDVSFVGRQAELARLNEDLARIDDGEPLLTLVTSPPGMGKSELLRHFAQQGSSDSDRIVVFGRCYERESLPYKALDPIADQLALYLASLADHNRGPLTQSLGYWLTKLFPSFRRVSALLREPSEFLSGLDPQVRRGRMFRAFRELLWRIASRQRLILVIDDFQWADSDSYLLLEEVLRGPDAPALHLVVSVRTDSDESARALAVSIGRRLPVRQRTIELGPLSPGEAAELSERQLKEPHRHDKRVASAIDNRVGG